MSIEAMDLILVLLILFTASSTSLMICGICLDSLLSKLAGVEVRKWWKLGHFLVSVRGCGLRLPFCCPSWVTRNAGFARRGERVGAGVERADRARRTERDRRTVAGAAGRRDWTGSS